MILPDKLRDHPLVLFPDFRNFIAGSVLVAVAARYFAIAIAWWVISLEGENGENLGILMAVQALPIFLLSPFIGPLIDRYNKKNCMIIGVCMQLFFLAVIVWLMYGDKLGFVTLAVLSFAMCCFMPQLEASISTSVAKLVDEERLTSAVALQSSIVEFSNIIAAVLSTSVIAVAGMLQALYLNIALYVCGTLFLFLIKVDLSAEPGNAEGEVNYWEELKRGLSYIWNYKELRAFGVVYACSAFFILPIFIMIPLLVKNVLHETVTWVAVLETCFSVGAVVMTVGMSFRQQYRNFYRKYAVVLAFTAIAMIVSGMGIHPNVVAGSMIVMGAMFAAMLALANMLFQFTVPQELKGRFFGLVATAIAGTAPLSYMFVGFVSDWLGVDRVMTVCGTGLLLLTVSVLLIPRVRRHIGYDDVIS
ncbi:MFS transporter [Sporomusa malonica]|uniref:MFS-type transporter involved in bile tolerance, Atg22 family n=1 Tax=Sporomusa malonica TaxID=112901 RepID=A0A1W2CPC6_9FIRM|nr:MFS transporter [Sporomusa malonica]SMC86722.1 MFS-type transporter involved in bile tolerance, Atg22 family [Sporomusa malonica]